MSIEIELAKRAGLVKPHGSDQEYIGDLDWRELVRQVAMDCIFTIQLHMPRNGVNSVENVRSKLQICKIAERYNIQLPSNYVSPEWENILAGEAIVEDFGGYEESTHEKQAEFARKRNGL
jgi:hypothetical protein